MTRYNYNNALVPPGPFVYTLITSTEEQPVTQQWPAQVDTGADRTVIPASLVREMSLTPWSEVEVAGLGHQTIRLPTFIVSISIEHVAGAPLKLEVLASEGEPHVLLGRDVLNRYRILLDGPNLSCELS